jgi:hypothetical protein
MEVLLTLDAPDAIFTSGKKVFGKVTINSPNMITVSKIVANLTGEATSTLTGSAGLLMSRKEEEKHLVSTTVYLNIGSLEPTLSNLCVNRRLYSLVTTVRRTRNVNPLNLVLGIIVSIWSSR